MAVQTWVVLSNVTVQRDGESVFVRKGSLVAIDPANTALMNAYGGAGNLGVPPRGDPANADRSAQAN